MIQEELRVSEEIRVSLLAGVEKLKLEMKELKKIIKVPRLHYKMIEDQDWENL